MTRRKDCRGPRSCKRPSVLPQAASFPPLAATGIIESSPSVANGASRTGPVCLFLLTTAEDLTVELPP